MISDRLVRILLLKENQREMKQKFQYNNTEFERLDLEERVDLEYDNKAINELDKIYHNGWKVR